MKLTQCLFLLSMAFFFLCPQTVCLNAELRTLIDIKAALDPHSLYLSSWTIDGDPCGGSFLGVACNELGQVANISLQGQGLDGFIPSTIGGLKSLSGLYLHFNRLSGGIPKEIAELTQLTDLYLNVNNLSGEIPQEIGNMSSLQGYIFWILYFSIAHSSQSFNFLIRFCSFCCLDCSGFLAVWTRKRYATVHFLSQGMCYVCFSFVSAYLSFCPYDYAKWKE